jgi:serine/threonine protein kinase
LRQYLQQEKPDAVQLRAILLELDSAVSSVHQAGLLHRDLKPENILIRTKEPLDLILTDFGIASALDATQKLTGTARTLHYAAPETLSGVISTKADYWALGMILLEALTGRHPFNQFLKQ